MTRQCDHFFHVFFFPLEFYKSLFLKIQVRICLFCHILCCSRYTVRNLVTVVKPIVWFNCLSGYIGLYHPRRLILCNRVKKERCDLGCTKIEKSDQKQTSRLEVGLTVGAQGQLICQIQIWFSTGG